MPEIFSFISNNLLTIHETLLKKILKLYRNVNRNKRTIIVMNNYHYFYQVWNLQKKKKNERKKKMDVSRSRDDRERRKRSAGGEGGGEIWRRIKRYGSSGLPVSRSCRCLPLEPLNVVGYRKPHWLTELLSLLSRRGSYLRREQRAPLSGRLVESETYFSLRAHRTPLLLPTGATWPFNPRENLSSTFSSHIYTSMPSSFFSTRFFPPPTRIEKF